MNIFGSARDHYCQCACIFESVLQSVMSFAGAFLNERYIKAAATHLREQLDFNIFGFDVIVENGTGELDITEPHSLQAMSVAFA